MVAQWMQRVHVAQGFPTKSTDTAPASVFLALFLITAASNFFLFFRNKKNGHKFIFNQLAGGFSMARVVTMILRLAWTYNIENRGLAIAATIFVAAGVLVLFILNLFFTQRIVRALHPHFGWRKLFSRSLVVIYALIPVLLVMVVTATTQIFFTTNKSVAMIDLNIQRAASTYFMVISFLPIPILVIAAAWPKRYEQDHFGHGLMWHKIALVMTASLLLSLGATFRTATVFYTFSPDHWFNAKWCFYFFNFTLEIVVVVMYLVFRMDLVFHVPDGSKGPNSYSSAVTGWKGNESPRSSTDSQQSTATVVAPAADGQAVEKLEV